MKLSEYFLPILKEDPHDAAIASHKLMLRAGMIKQQASGIYTWLPLGLKLLKNIEKIVRKNMDQIGFVEILMPTIQPAHLWKESGRYDDYGAEMLRITDRHNNELLYGPTNEEMVTEIFRSYCQSYKDLPKLLYHIQWKFRDEIRPRFGVLRGREFLMKDAYSFDYDEKNAIETYNKIFLAYLKSFKDMGLNSIAVKADSGPIGGDFSHEFHILADTGESTLYYDKKFDELEISDDENIVNKLQNIYAVAEEKYDPENCPVSKENLREKKGIEVGHIFLFGEKYSKPMKASVNDKSGNLSNIYGGSYGIGISRLVAAIIEANHDDRGIIWPMSVAPFKLSIVNLSSDDENAINVAESIIKAIKIDENEILYDDTDQRAGVKFATHDLIGSPYQIIVGRKKLEQNLVELKERKTGVVIDLTPGEAVKFLNEKLSTK